MPGSCRLGCPRAALLVKLAATKLNVFLIDKERTFAE